MSAPAADRSGGYAWPGTTSSCVSGSCCDNGGGLAATLLIGAVAGLYPAIRASCLAPTEALATTWSRPPVYRGTSVLGRPAHRRQRRSPTDLPAGLQIGLGHPTHAFAVHIADGDGYLNGPPSSSRARDSASTSATDGSRKAVVVQRHSRCKVVVPGATADLARAYISPVNRRTAVRRPGSRRSVWSSGIAPVQRDEPSDVPAVWSLLGGGGSPAAQRTDPSLGSVPGHVVVIGERRRAAGLLVHRLQIIR